LQQVKAKDPSDKFREKKVFLWYVKLMNELRIIKQLNKYFANADYKLQNVFIWNWESDFFCVTSSGYTVEVEVKISKSDFKADAKKEQKHFMLKNIGKELAVMPTHSYIRDASGIAIVRPRGPNKFYYCCPKGIINPEEVPEYAGLLYYTEEEHSDNLYSHQDIIEVKTAKFLHKNKPDISKVMLDKYYNMYNDLKNQYNSLKRYADRMQEQFNPDYPLTLSKKHQTEPKYFSPELWD
jgi:hypothetical protein